MDLPGSAYLYTLATLSMTFVGFCAIAIVLRQSIGAEMSGWHIVLTRLYIESGLWAAAFSMLAPLLALCGLTAPTVFRVSSGIIALSMLVYGATYARRRRLMMTERIPVRRWLGVTAGSLLVIVGLLSNAAGLPFAEGVAPIAIAATWTLGCGAVIFMLALDTFWKRAS
jgi:hypothetical protein